VATVGSSGFAHRRCSASSSSSFAGPTARDGKLPFSEHLSRVFATSKAIAAPTITIGVIAIALLNLLWPRADIYNATPPFHWYLQYGPILFTAALPVIGPAYYGLVARHHDGVLESHLADDAEPVASLAAEASEV
jgi:hypothetical protein